MMNENEMKTKFEILEKCVKMKQAILEKLQTKSVGLYKNSCYVGMLFFGVLESCYINIEYDSDMNQFILWLVSKRSTNDIALFRFTDIH